MDINLHTPQTIYTKRHLPSWYLLAAAAGTVNGVAFLESEQFVTHVTGTVTRLGLEWPHLWTAAEYALILLSFLAGAIASVVWIQARANRGKRPRWSTPLLVVALILVGVAISGEADLFGKFGGIHTTDPPPAVLLSLLAFAMGLQNAAVAFTTGLAVRTTHLSGPTTDLGVHIGTALLTAGEERRQALRGAVLRGGKLISFLLGSALALPLTHAGGFLALLVPAAFVLAADLLSFAPEWSPSDYPHRRDHPTPRSEASKTVGAR